MMEVSVQLNRTGVRRSASPSGWPHKGKTRKQTPNSVHSGGGEIVYGADIAGGNENVYNMWV